MVILADFYPVERIGVRVFVVREEEQIRTRSSGETIFDVQHDKSFYLFHRRVVQLTCMVQQPDLPD